MLDQIHGKIPEVFSEGISEENPGDSSRKKLLGFISFFLNLQCNVRTLPRGTVVFLQEVIGEIQKKKFHGLLQKSNKKLKENARGITKSKPRNIQEGTS